MISEIWSDAFPFAGFYQVSDQGNVRRVARLVETCDGRQWHLSERLLKPYRSRDGYRRVTLTLGGVQWTRQVSILVAAAFHGERPPGHEVHHVNRCRWDDRAVNLEYRDGRTHLIDHFRGESNPAAKITEAIVFEIKMLLGQGWSQRKVAAHLGLSQPLISRINTGQRWGHVFSLGELSELSF